MLNENLEQQIKTIFTFQFLQNANTEWKQQSLAELSKMYQPKTISGKDLIADGNYFVYGANGIIGKYNQYNHSESEIAVACRGASCGSIQMTLPFSWITGNAMVVRPHSDFPYREYLYYYLLAKNPNYLCSGSAQPQLIVYSRRRNYMMSVSDWISIICAGVALIVTVIIAVLQIRQSNRMERFEKRQDKRDEQRHQESVKAQAVSFISKYYKDRGLIPLCAIATMYNDLFYYNREMYREFCCCTKEVQNRILEYCDLDLRVSEYNIYEKCLVAIESVLNKRFPDDKSVFYDGGKYFTRSLEYYADKPIPHQEFEYQNHITDVLANAFNSNDKKETPIQQLSVEYSFGSCKEIEACQLVTVIAEFAAIYGNKNKNIDKSYGSPGGYDGEVIETMEDLFLLALFEIYTNCVL